MCRNRLGIICDLWSCQYVQSWLNLNADMRHTVVICLKWWPTLWAHRLHAYMDITSSRRCGLAIWLGEIYQNYQPLIDAYFSLLTMYIYLGEFQAMTEILLVLMLWPICNRNRHLSKVQNMPKDQPVMNSCLLPMWRCPLWLSLSPTPSLLLLFNFC